MTAVTAPLVIIGAGGWGRETIDIARAAGRHVLGVVDDAPDDHALALLRRRRVPYLGTIEEWLEPAGAEEHVIAVNSPTLREAIDSRLAGHRTEPTTLIHPSAILGDGVELSPGTIIGPGVIIGSNVSGGRHLHCGATAVVGHDARIGHHVALNPRSTISGAVAIADGALIGAAAVVLQGLSIGRSAVVGASACVTRDIPPETVSVGVPSRSRHVAFQKTPGLQPGRSPRS